jgi:hypothetical protein
MLIASCLHLIICRACVEIERSGKDWKWRLVIWMRSAPTIEEIGRIWMRMAIGYAVLCCYVAGLCVCVFRCRVMCLNGLLL